MQGIIQSIAIFGNRIENIFYCTYGLVRISVRGVARINGAVSARGDHILMHES